MVDEKIEQAFYDAQELYNVAHPFHDIPLPLARYFFFAGSEFGLASAKRIYGIYDESHPEEEKSDNLDWTKATFNPYP